MDVALDATLSSLHGGINSRNAVAFVFADLIIVAACLFRSFFAWKIDHYYLGEHCG